jgi:hypothetical protein
MIEATRREAIAGALAAGVAAVLAPPVYGQAQVTVADFLKLSQNLTGAAQLDPQIAATLLQGFVATDKGGALAALAAKPDSAEPALANAIVAAWYSGVYDSGKGQAVATYDQALVWDALTFTKPMGSCGGETGYWSQPPQT